MPLTSNGRRDAIYNAIAANDPNFSKLSTAEKDFLKAQLGLIWGGGDLAYLTGNAQISPGSMAVVPASLVAPVGGGPCSGSGSVATGTGTLG